jgi:hypothetical protein
VWELPGIAERGNESMPLGSVVFFVVVVIVADGGKSVINAETAY